MPTGTQQAFAATSLLMIAALSILVELVGAPVKEALAFQREAVLSGQSWRVVTGHLVHLGPRHMLLNVGALLVLAWLLHRWPPDLVRLGSAGCGTAVGVGLLLLIASPSVGFYVGLSGWLHGLAVLVITVSWRRDPLVSALLASGLVAKLAWEAVSGPNPATEAAIGGPVVAVAHRYGALSAVVSLLLASAWTWARQGFR